MRETQFVGLNNSAIDWLSKNCVYEYDRCPHCNENLENTKRLKVVGENKIIEGMFGEEVYKLKVYRTSNDYKISEVE